MTPPSGPGKSNGCVSIRIRVQPVTVVKSTQLSSLHLKCTWLTNCAVLNETLNSLYFYTRSRDFLSLHTRNRDFFSMIPEQENKTLSTKKMELTSPVGMLRVLRTQLIPPNKKVTMQVSLEHKYVNMASLKFPIPNFRRH
jgi:hypothetical protein